MVERIELNNDSDFSKEIKDLKSDLSFKEINNKAKGSAAIEANKEKNPILAKLEATKTNDEVLAILKDLSLEDMNLLKKWLIEKKNSSKNNKEIAKLFFKDIDLKNKSFEFVVEYGSSNYSLSVKEGENTKYNFSFEDEMLYWKVVYKTPTKDKTELKLKLALEKANPIDNKALEKKYQWMIDILEKEIVTNVEILLNNKKKLAYWDEERNISIKKFVEEKYVDPNIRLNQKYILKTINSNYNKIIDLAQKLISLKKNIKILWVNEKNQKIKLNEYSVIIKEVQEIEKKIKEIDKEIIERNDYLNSIIKSNDLILERIKVIKF